MSKKCQIKYFVSHIELFETFLKIKYKVSVDVIFQILNLSFDMNGRSSIILRHSYVSFPFMMYHSDKIASRILISLNYQRVIHVAGILETNPERVSEPRNLLGCFNPQIL